MKKEYQIVGAIGLFALAYALDYFAGPISATIKNPFVLGNFLDKYPFTAVGIASRSLAIMLTVNLILSLVGSTLAKALSALFLGGLFELYAIQQLATSAKMTTLQWTLSLAYGGFLLAFLIIYYLIIGVVKGLHQGLSDQRPNSETDSSQVS
jgi:hypothetical protein